MVIVIIMIIIAYRYTDTFSVGQAGKAKSRRFLGLAEGKVLINTLKEACNLFEGILEGNRGVEKEGVFRFSKKQLRMRQ